MSQKQKPPDPQPRPGSPPPGEPVFLAVGRLRKAHGIHGDLRLEILTDFPERLKPGVVVFVGPERRSLRLIRSRGHGAALLVAFEGFATPEQTASLRNQIVFVRADDRPELGEGEYYHHQLIGLRVTTENGEVIGTLEEILETGANDVYIIRSPTGSEILLPGIVEVVQDINLEAGLMRVRPLPGLLPGDG